METSIITTTLSDRSTVHAVAFMDGSAVVKLHCVDEAAAFRLQDAIEQNVAHATVDQFADLSEAQDQAAGEKLAELLGLKPARDDNNRHFNPPRFNTAGGTKTAIGLARTVRYILQSAE